MTVSSGSSTQKLTLEGGGSQLAHLPNGLVAIVEPEDEKLCRSTIVRLKIYFRALGLRPDPGLLQSIADEMVWFYQMRSLEPVLRQNLLAVREPPTGSTKKSRTKRFAQEVLINQLADLLISRGIRLRQYRSEFDGTSQLAVMIALLLMPQKAVYCLYKRGFMKSGAGSAAIEAFLTQHKGDYVLLGDRTIERALRGRIWTPVSIL